MTGFDGLIKSGISWEVELTSRCNSRCVGCSRYSEFYYPNPFLDPRVDLDINIFKKALRESPGVKFVLFCGNYGDPLLYPRIFDILRFIREERGDLGILVHSNASFGQEKFWQELAFFFQTPGSYVKFSLDGFSDSHEMFRRGSKWEVAFKNAQVFIQNGGRAVWQMIDFQHNHHEIEKARSFALQNGFRRFDLRPNNYVGLDVAISNRVPNLDSVPSTVSASARTEEELLAWYESQISEKSVDVIDCKSLGRKNLYLDVHGRVWPCCWVGGLPYRPEHELREWFHKKVLARYDSDFNSLKDRSLEGILAHSWWREHLPASWDLKKGNPAEILTTCLKTCGKCLPAEGENG